MSAFKDQIEGVYPDSPGYKEKGGASEAAAKIIEPMLKKNQAETLAALNRAGQPMTADELADFMGKPFVSVRPRLSELRRLGKIMPTGDYRPSQFGQPATVWKIKPTAAEAAAQ